MFFYPKIRIFLGGGVHLEPKPFYMGDSNFSYTGNSLQFNSIFLNKVSTIHYISHVSD